MAPTTRPLLHLRRWPRSGRRPYSQAFARVSVYQFDSSNMRGTWRRLVGTSSKVGVASNHSCTPLPPSSLARRATSATASTATATVAIVFASVGVLVGAFYMPSLVEYTVPELDKARYSVPSRTQTWAIAAFVASLPANLGCIAGCATFLALYDRHVPDITVPTGTAGAWASSGGVGLPPHMGTPTIVRIVTEAEAAQMRMAAQPPPTVGSVPGFDLVAVPRGVCAPCFFNSMIRRIALCRQCPLALPSPGASL